MSQLSLLYSRYMDANQRCKSAEETIQRETENMEQLSKMVEEKFNEVSLESIKFNFWPYGIRYNM